MCVCVCDLANLVLREYLTDFFFANLISYFFIIFFFGFGFVIVLFNAVHNHFVQDDLFLYFFSFAWNELLHVLNFICFIYF